MYLPRSSKWSMNRRRRRPNYFGWAIFVLVVLFGYYFNQVYLPTSPVLAGATPTPTRSAESYVTDAEDLFNQGKLTQSIEAYTSAITASPQNPTLYIALARVQVWAGKYTDAEKNAENALLLDNSNSMALAVHAWAMNFQPGRNGEALADIEQAVEKDPNNPVILSYYVEILVDSGFDNYQKAIDLSKVVVALDPNIVETHRARGYLLNATNVDGSNIELAIHEYDEAIKINPNLGLLYMEQGQNYRAISARDEAIKAFTVANTLNPPDPEPDYWISRTYATFGEYSKALQYAESAATDAPSDPKYHGNWGVMFYRNFYYDDAVRELGLAIYGGTTKDGVKVTGVPLTNNTRISEYYFTMALALARTNQCGQALEIVQELQSRVPTDEIAMDAANKSIDICQENLNNPPTSTPALPIIPDTATPTVPAISETPTP